jgi:amidophosphoribosyltransferase
MKEACGVVGIYAPRRAVAPLAYDALFALQHRGQESAGMAVSDGSTITVVKDMGLVASVFSERTLSCLPGSLCIGHTRYSTGGPSTWENAQPVYRSSGMAGFALAHNGNLTNTRAMAASMGVLPGLGMSDSDLLADLLARKLSSMGSEGREDLAAALAQALLEVQGAYSLVAMDARTLVGVRDPFGFRPLCIGKLPAGAQADGQETPEGFVIASESPALDVVGASLLREVSPGEMVVIDEEGMHSLEFAKDATKMPRTHTDLDLRSTSATSVPTPMNQEEHVSQERLCIFEFVYFARPDSILLGKEVYEARHRMGEMLATERPVRADLVIGVPDSGIPAAEGYAAASGIPYGQGLVKNRYIGRTFIAPEQHQRTLGVHRKLNPLRSTIQNRRLVVVDDSIVRGTTTKAIVALLREAGAKEVHLRISSPPFRWPCFYGIDTPERSELLAARMEQEGAFSEEEIARVLGADSVAYLSYEHLVDAIGVRDVFCNACLSGDYPVRVADRDSFEGARAHEEFLQGDFGHVLRGPLVDHGAQAPRADVGSTVGATPLGDSTVGATLGMPRARTK